MTPGKKAVEHPMVARLRHVMEQRAAHWSEMNGADRYLLIRCVDSTFKDCINDGLAVEASHVAREVEGAAALLRDVQGGETR